MDNNNNNSKNKLYSIPFSTKIDCSLKACIEAQAMAAKTTWDFIQEVGLKITYSLQVLFFHTLL